MGGEDRMRGLGTGESAGARDGRNLNGAPCEAVELLAPLAGRCGNGDAAASCSSGRWRGARARRGTQSMAAWKHSAGSSPKAC